MRKAALITLLLLLLAGGVGTETANAHMLKGKHNLSYANRTIRHARYTIQWVTSHKQLYIKLGHMREYRVALRDHRWLLQWGLQLRAKFTPQIAHYTGWHCITYGAYPGAPHEGHGYNGPYSGALQMTTPWEGLRLPWASMSDAAVYQVAERVAASHGFSYTWMAGQWPRTFPPCAGYFR